MKVEGTRGAVEDLEKLDPQVVKRILKRIAWLSENFSRIIPEPLGGEFKGTYRLRVGNWRIIYTVEGDSIVIRFVGHRREIYQ